MQYPCNAFGLLSKKQYAPNAEIRFMIKLLTDQWRILPNTAKKMKVLAMADESTFDGQRKYLRCPSQVLAFFGGMWFNFKGLNANFYPSSG